MNDKVLMQIANKIKDYLQSDCADEWHINIVEKSIIAYYTNIKEFVLTFDEDFEDWYISGEDLYVDMVAKINEILQEYTT